VELADAGEDGAEIAAGEDQVGEDDEDWEDDADEALGEDVDGAADCEEPRQRVAWVGLLNGVGFGDPVEEEGEGEPEADVCVG